MLERPESPGRMVRMSAVGLYWELVIPKACSNCGVATYSGPDQLRPPPLWLRLASVESSSTTSREPRAVAMAYALAESGRISPAVAAFPGMAGPEPGPPDA